MRKYGESKTTRIMIATVPHVNSGSGLRKFQADGFLLDRVYNTSRMASMSVQWWMLQTTGAIKLHVIFTGSQIINSHCLPSVLYTAKGQWIFCWQKNTLTRQKLMAFRNVWLIQTSHSCRPSRMVDRYQGSKVINIIDIKKCRKKFWSDYPEGKRSLRRITRN